MSEAALVVEGLRLFTLKVHRDERGFFLERYQQERFRAFGLPDFCQDNHSRSDPRVLRGLHYQLDPPQGKLVGVIRGRIWDVAVDLRPKSSTFGKIQGIELNDELNQLLWIPAGVAHGFCTLGDQPADVLYKVDAPYNAKGEGGILWSDPDLAIPWPIQNPILSKRDGELEPFAAYCRRIGVEVPK